MASDHALLVRYLGELPSLVILGLLAVVSVRLFKRFGGLPAMLLLIGSAALVLGRIIGIGIGLIILPYVFTHPNGWAQRHLWPTCTENPAIDYGRDILIIGGVALFCVGFIWFGLRITRRDRAAPGSDGFTKGAPDDQNGRREADSFP
jgi:hypothetical protein